MDDIFLITALDKVLLYAPLHHYARTLENSIASQILDHQGAPDEDKNSILFEIREHLNKLERVEIAPLEGQIREPLFLGLITTRACDMRCRYCDFPSPKNSQRMPIEIAKKSIDNYMSILSRNGIEKGQIEFFGGEPFVNKDLIQFAVGYARFVGNKHGIDIGFNVTTNGLLSADLCEWVGDHFDTVTLSFDGFAKFQNRNRPLIRGAESFERVQRTAKILSEKLVDLIIRVCVTDQSVNEMENTARWCIEQFNVDKFCFEPLYRSTLSDQNEIFPPEPEKFAINFLRTEDMLSKQGASVYKSGVNIDEIQGSFCPAGKDAIIINGDGEVNACYQLNTDWQRNNLEMKFGYVDDRDSLAITEKTLQDIRNLGPAFSPQEYPLCQNCFCKYHCAGGCHVNRSYMRNSSEYDDVCAHTQIITLGRLLKRIGAYELYDRWLQAPNEIHKNISFTRIAIE